MSKLAPSSTKYIVRAYIKAKGVVEKPDVIGAIFGQTEGLLGSELNLRELQSTGKIGRIEVNVKSVKGNSEGEIVIPSSLSSAETALIAATLETIERIGPCTAKIKLERVEDAMSKKRKYVVEKAKDILKGLVESSTMDTDEISEEIKESVRTQEISSYKGLPCGPALMESDNIIIVEGRADVLNLLKYGIKNAVALQGTSVPPQVAALSKEKSTTVLVDGDRGGDLIIKELTQVAEIDFITKAPEGKEVEELTKKEVYKALRDKIPAKQYKVGTRVTRPEKTYKPAERQTRRPVPQRTQRTDSYRKPRISLEPSQKTLFKKTLEDLVGTRAACIFDQKNEILGRVPVTELENTIRTLENPYAVVFDGKVDYKIESVIRKKNTIKLLIGMDKEDLRSPINILCRKDL